MQAEFEYPLWNDYVQRDNQFRLQRPVEPDFGNGQRHELILGMPNVDTSAGDNSKAGFVAHALSARVADKYGPGAVRHLRLEDVTQSDMRNMLRDHLAWKKRNDSSVTTPPLFALQLALQKTVRMRREQEVQHRLDEKVDEKENGEVKESIAGNDKRENTRDDVPGKRARVDLPEGNIYRSIMDTSSLPEDTVLHAMIKVYENGERLTLNSGYFIAEYLVWEVLKVDSCHVPFDLLLKKGFMTLFDRFRQKPNTLQAQVQKLRAELFDYGPIQNKKRTPFPHETFDIAIRLAASFGDNWQLQMFVSFLALSRRWYTGDSIIEGAMRAIDGKMFPQCRYMTLRD